jgi:hypothetical protein
MREEGFIKNESIQPNWITMDRKTNAGGDGYTQILSTLSQVLPEILSQKRYEVNPTLFVPFVEGQAPWLDESLMFTSGISSEDPEAGIVSMSNSAPQDDAVDIEISAIRNKRFFWRRSKFYSVNQIQQFSKLGVLGSLVEEKEKATLKVYDILVQRTAFMGAHGGTGLLNNPDVAINAALITAPISTLSVADFNGLAGKMVAAFRNANFGTAFPDTLAISETDFFGLSNFPDATYPIKTRIEILEDAFKLVTMNPSFKILPNRYSESGVVTSSKSTYALYRRSPDVLRLEQPVPYTVTNANTANGFNFATVSYAQLSNVWVLRPLEMLYLQY